MGMNKLRIAVYIGRFQPFHKGHLRVVKYALKNYDRLVLVLGSAQPQPRTLKNPWTANERWCMIVSNFSRAELGRINVVYQRDQPEDDHAWAKDLRIAAEYFGRAGDEFTLVGADKDESTFYLKLFPFWKKDLLDPAPALNATDVRNAYFSNVYVLMYKWSKNLPKGTVGFLSAFRAWMRPELEKLVQKAHDDKK